MKQKNIDGTALFVKANTSVSIPIRREVIDSCPYCNDEQPLKGYNTLADIHPELSSYWSSKNIQKFDEITLSEAKIKNIYGCATVVI